MCRPRKLGPFKFNIGPSTAIVASVAISGHCDQVLNSTLPRLQKTHKARPYRNKEARACETSLLEILTPPSLLKNPTLPLDQPIKTQL